jgi:hypothetical protein
MKKYINDKGEVGVLVSRGYGVGWSTWNNFEYSEYLCMDKTLVEMKLKGVSTEDVREHLSKVKEVYFYVSGWEDAEVEWLERGTNFRINVYDGNESLEYGAIGDMVA